VSAASSPAGLLRCPTCRRPLADEGRTWVCPEGHRFPVQEGLPLFAAGADEGVFGDYAEHYDAGHGSPWVVEHLLSRRLEMLKPYLPPEAPILEVGCGTGSFLGQVIGRVGERPGSYYHGVDLSPSMLRQAARRLGRSVILAQADGQRLPFADGTFGLVYCQALLHHIHRRLESNLEEMFRVLLPGGVLWLLDSNPWNPLWWYYIIQPYEGDIKQISTRRLAGVLRSLGADRITCSYHGAMPHRLPAGLLTLFQRLERTWERLPGLNRFSTHYLVTCRKGLR